MREAEIEHTGLFLGECGNCRGSFLYNVEGNAPREDSASTPGGKVFLVGKCPLCGGSSGRR